MAKWINMGSYHECSTCGYVPPKREIDIEKTEIDEYLTPFCPICGSKMYDPAPDDVQKFSRRLT